MSSRLVLARAGKIVLPSVTTVKAECPALQYMLATQASSAQNHHRDHCEYVILVDLLLMLIMLHVVMLLLNVY